MHENVLDMNVALHEKRVKRAAELYRHLDKEKRRELLAAVYQQRGVAFYIDMIDALPVHLQQEVIEF